MDLRQEDSWRRSRDVAHQLYRAAMHPDPLNNWARLISELLNTQTVGLTVFAPSGVAVGSGALEMDNSGGRDFLERYQYINPLWNFWKSAPEGEVIPLQDCLDRVEVRRTEFYTRYCDYLETGGACMMLSARRSKILVHARLPGQPHARQMAIDLLTSVRDDLLLSFEIASTFASASNMVSNIIRGLDQKGISAAILSEDGRVENSNLGMDGLLRAGAVLRIDRCHLAPGPRVPTREFTELIRRTRTTGVGGRLPYRDSSGAQVGAIVAHPASSAFGWDAMADSKVVLLVTDNARRTEVLTEKLRRDYGLTMAEARVVGLLREGKTSRQIATELQVQTNSVRAHLKATYAKTGAHSQVELLNLLQFETDFAAAPIGLRLN